VVKRKNVGNKKDSPRTRPGMKWRGFSMSWEEGEKKGRRNEEPEREM